MPFRFKSLLNVSTSIVQNGNRSTGALSRRMESHVGTKHTAYCHGIVFLAPFARYLTIVPNPNRRAVDEYWVRLQNRAASLRCPLPTAPFTGIFLITVFALAFPFRLEIRSLGPSAPIPSQGHANHSRERRGSRQALACQVALWQTSQGIPDVAEPFFDWRGDRRWRSSSVSSRRRMPMISPRAKRDWMGNLRGKVLFRASRSRPMPFSPVMGLILAPLGRN